MKTLLFAIAAVVVCLGAAPAKANGYYGFYDQVGPFTGVRGWGDVRPRPYLRTVYIYPRTVTTKRRHGRRHCN
jgi:hypothetical protein